MKRAGTALVVLTLLAGCQKSEVTAVSADPAAAASNTGSSAPQVLPSVAPEVPVPSWASSAAINDNLKCYLDILNNEGGAGEGKPRRELKIGVPANISGWAINTTKKGPQPQAFVVFTPQQPGDSYFFRANRNPRPDVEAASEFAVMKPEKSGVTIVADTGMIKPGAYQIEYVIGDEGESSRCSVGQPWVVNVIK